MTGSFDRIAITGRDGLTLAEKWRAGPRAYLGVATAGFPNLFTITGPGSPSVLASMIQAIEQHVDWMADCMAHMRDIGAATIEPIQTYEDEWVEHVNEVSKVSLRSTCSSWYVGANIPGRPRVFMPYIGGFPVYVQKCNEVMSNGFEGFVIDGAERRQRSAARAADRAMARAARHRRHLAGGGRRAARAGGVKALSRYRLATSRRCGLIVSSSSTLSWCTRGSPERAAHTEYWLTEHASACRSSGVRVTSGLDSLSTIPPSCTSISSSARSTPASLIHRTTPFCKE